MSRIAVVEDNEDLREEILFHLQRAGHVARGAADAVGFDALHAATPFDLVVLDLGLPGEDGLSLAARLRREGGVRIVMLTARGSLDERVTGLDAGADAYLVKPVDMRELLAVVASVTRRLPESAAWVLEGVRRRLLAPGGQAVDLTDTEFRLLEAMIAAAPEVASRRDMAIALGETDFLAYDERRLEAAVSRLRRKLLAATGESPLRAARGRGYVFAATVRRG